MKCNESFPFKKDNFVICADAAQIIYSKSIFLELLARAGQKLTNRPKLAEPDGPKCVGSVKRFKQVQRFKVSGLVWIVMVGYGLE